MPESIMNKMRVSYNFIYFEITGYLRAYYCQIECALTKHNAVARIPFRIKIMVGVTIGYG